MIEALAVLILIFLIKWVFRIIFPKDPIPIPKKIVMPIYAMKPMREVVISHNNKKLLEHANLAKQYPMIAVAMLNGYTIESVDPLVMSRFDSEG